MKNTLHRGMMLLKGIPFVITGSMAMKLYANKYGVTMRDPLNVNFVVNKNNMRNAVGRLSNGSTQAGYYISNHYNLKPYDLLKAGTNLAPRINSYVNLNGVPVVPLNKLLKQKQMTLNNYPPHNLIPKIKGNINKIQNILRKKSPNTIVTRKKKSPSPRKSPTMSTTRKQLF
jgi:hypothetical protein